MLFSHTLRLESAPLHTERPILAAQAPAQATAAFLRGAHVIGFTEVNPKSKVSTELSALAKKHGYAFIHGDGDTALAVKDRLRILDASPWIPVHGSRGYTRVRFDFHGNIVTVYNQHWATNVPAHHETRVAQTNALIDAMHQASRGKRLAFYMGDANPDMPLEKVTGFPRCDLESAKCPLIYTSLNRWPPHIGVNVLGHSASDRRVKAKAVGIFDPLGSDHAPVQGHYKIKKR